jgi:Zn-dependent peptidase ImmA (M78 family)/DNA-binding XRE family transcriptional regulator
VIYGERVSQARFFLGVNQKQFASMIGVSQARLSGIENSGQATVTDHVLVAMAEAAGFPACFFEQPPSGRVDDVQFRARLTFKAADRYQAMACADMIHETYAKMRAKLDVPAVAIRRMEGLDPRQAARDFRATLALPSGPILNLTSPVERAGVTLLTLPIAGKKHDAFSTWQPYRDGEYPLIVTFSGSPGDRLRWNIAHELGHILLHRGGSGKEIESEADTFAAELLTPIDLMSAEIPMHPRLGALYAMKLRWGVSVQSMIRRAREVGCVSDQQYTSLFRQVSARGERMNERYQIAREKPRIYRKMAELLYGESPAVGLSALGRWTEEFGQDVLEQYASKTELPSRRVFVKARPSDDSSNVVEFRRHRQDLA